MKILTELPISQMAFAHWHTDDTEVGVVVAKAAFALSMDGKTSPQAVPPDLEMGDVFAGNPAASHLVTEQDIAPLKPKTDLIIRGSAQTYDAELLTDWPVKIEIPGKLHHSFHVRGPLHWQKQMMRWQLTKPERVTEVPLTYALAYGGSCEEDEGPVYCDQNPAGLGFMTDDALGKVKHFPAPQIGLLAEFMSAKPTEQLTVLGTMPIAKTWLPRRSLGGTFDENREKNAIHVCRPTMI